MDDDSRAPGWRALFNSAGTEPVLESALPDWAGLGRVRAPLREVVRTLREGKHEPAAPAAAPEPAVGAGASFLQGEHAEAAGTRRYRLYLPASLAGKPPRGLLMMLHGCGQTAEDFAVGTAMNRQAEARRLIVVYPEQTRCDNPATCWNWFRPGDQRRDSGEPAILAGLARHLQAEHAVPDGATFVAGLSAGGSMAAVLGATYPDVFAAVGVHSAVPQGRATDAFSAIAAMRGDTLPSAGQAGLPVPVIVFHGDADSVVHPSNAERLADAGRPVGRPGRIGTAGGRKFRRRVERRTDGVPALEYWVVDGAGHAWSGGDPAGSFADPDGPDASAEMVRFFLGKAARAA